MRIVEIVEDGEEVHAILGPHSGRAYHCAHVKEHEGGQHG